MSLEKFSKNLQDFVGELNLTFPETPIADDAFDVVSEEHMETFLTEMEPFMTEVSRYNPTTFKTEEPVVVLEHLELTRYFSHNISSSTAKSIFNYLHILYILAFRSLREINTDVDLNSDEPSESELFFTLVKNIRRSKQEPTEPCCESTTCDAESSDNPLNALFGAGGGGLIGELAEDIARDINIEDLGNPMDLMGMLMGGKSDSAASGNIMNLIKKVGDKVKNKIDSGELDQGQLLNEAQNLMGSMGNLGGGGAGGLDLGGLDIGNMAKMLSGMMPGAPSEATINRRLANNKDVALMQRKERLRKRLAERKARELEKNAEPEDAGEGSGKRRRRRRKKKRKEKVEENTN